MSRINLWVGPSFGLFCGLFAAAVPSASWGQTAPIPDSTTVAVHKPVRHHGSHHEHSAKRHKDYRHDVHHEKHHNFEKSALRSGPFPPAQTFPGQSGGTQIVYGQAIGTQIGNGGRQVVSANGFASSSQIQAGGVQSIAPGGAAAGTIVSGVGANQVVSANATSTGDALFNGGTQTVYGQAVNTKIGVDGQQTVSAGGVSTNATTSGPGAAQIVSANAKAVGGSVADGGVQTVYGQSEHTQIGAMAKQTVSAGGVSTDASAVGAGAAQVVLSGGTAVGTSLASGATQTVYGTSIGAKLGCCAANSAALATPTVEANHPSAPQAVKPSASYNPQTQPSAALPRAEPFVMLSLFKGIPVGQQLQSWGQKNGWKVVWASGVDPVPAKNLYYFSGFEQAAKDAVTDLNQEGFALKATFSEETHTLMLSQN